MEQAVPSKHELDYAQEYSMKPHSAKAKGRRLQQWIRDKIIEAFNLTTDDVYSRSMGACGTDVYLSPAGKTRFPFSIEAKNQEGISIYKAWDQAVMNVQGGCDPLLVYKKNGRDPLAILDFNTFIRLVLLASANSGTSHG